MTGKKEPWKWTEKGIVETYKMPNGKVFHLCFVPGKVLIYGKEIIMGTERNLVGNIEYRNDKKRIVIGDIDVSVKGVGIGTFALERLRQIAKSEGIKDFEIAGGKNTKYWLGKLKMRPVTEDIRFNYRIPDGMWYQKKKGMHIVDFRMPTNSDFLVKANPSIAEFKKVSMGIADVRRNLSEEVQGTINSLERRRATHHKFYVSARWRTRRAVTDYEKIHGTKLEVNFKKPRLRRKKV